MKFYVESASGDTYKEELAPYDYHNGTILIFDIEELLELAQLVQAGIIIDRFTTNDGLPKLTIYDDFLE